MRNMYVIALLALLAAGCAAKATFVKSVDPSDMIHVSQVSEAQIASGKKGTVVFYLNKGDTVPLMLTVQTNLVEPVSEKIDLVLLKKVYFMIITPEMPAGKIDEPQKMKLIRKMKIYASSDAENWALVQNHNALKKIFGWDKGYLSFGFGITKEQGVHATLGLGTTDVKR
jgi:hypothetical protein